MLSATWSRASARSWRAPLRWTPWSAAASPAIPKPPASGRSTSGGARKAIGRCSTSCCQKAPLRPGLTPEAATHLLLLYLGMDVYRVLVHDLAWTHAAWIDWVVATIALELFGTEIATHG